MVRQCVHQSPGVIAVTRMHHEPRWLVDEQQSVVFIHNIERNILGIHPILIRRMRQKDAHHIERLYAVVGFYGHIIHINVSVFCRFLDFAPRSVGNEMHQEFIDTQQFLPFGDINTQMLE